MTPARVAVVGAGHAGLCVVEALARRGIRTLVFDDADRLGDTWRSRFDGLVLNTHRDLSAIPAVPLPPSMGQWPERDEWADHIEQAAETFGVERRRERVTEISAVDGGWLVRSVPCGDDGSSVPTSFDVVVVATGRHRVATMPPWPGLDTTTIEVMHSQQYRNPGPFAGRRVLVVGGGNSGTEIAHLVASAGIETLISIRRRPVFARREMFGTNLTSVARLAKWMPERLVDLSGRLMQRVLFGSLRKVGLGPPQHRLSDVEAAAGATIDSGFVDDVRAGRIEVVDALERFDGECVVTADGRRLRVDVVVAATGYEPRLDDLLPAELLDDGWPKVKDSPFRQALGLYTAGLNPATLTAFHPDFINEADQIAATIATDLATDPTTFA